MLSMCREWVDYPKSFIFDYHVSCLSIKFRSVNEKKDSKTYLLYLSGLA